MTSNLHTGRRYLTHVTVENPAALTDPKQVGKVPDRHTTAFIVRILIPSTAVYKFNIVPIKVSNRRN